MSKPIGDLVRRSGRVAFYGVPAAGGSGDPIFTRMRGFTDMVQSKNAKEYNRQYVDEDFEQSDVVGFSPSVSYTFDDYRGNAVHEDIVKLTDSEAMGNDAIRQVIMVDIATKKAIKRDFVVVPDSEGDGTDSYAYSGNLKVKGEKVEGTVATNDEWQTCTFTPDTVEPEQS
ncbi:hypothetical protein [Eubacterium sp.]|uniref:hypothetical protein n=1 Tax=Eubacterium sp. TaxID=142586 RepID=UPI0026E096C0|nr:hypothetical protein [Eubacterium sp.]MDO5432968.1 hypothetical protein [Eubacterium sp.]